MTDDGTEVKAGGRVVKNVAGYDMMKLQIGALGTLGIVTQLTLKVKPKPEASAAVAFGCDSAALASVLDALAASKSRPVAVELLNPAAWRAGSVSDRSFDEWAIAVGFEEKAATVRWQVSTLLDELKTVPGRDVHELPDTSFCATLTRMQLRPESRFIRKLSVLPSQTADTMLKASSGTALVHAHGLTGVVWLHDGEEAPPGAVIRRCPTELKKSLPVWGEQPNGWELMRHVKHTLDPDNVFNAGRVFGN